MVVFYFSVLVAAVAAKCENDILLTPNELSGTVYHGTYYQLSNLLDGSYSTYWMSSSGQWQNMYFYFSEEVSVEWIYVQRYDDDATQIYIYDDGNRVISHTYFGDQSERYASITLTFDDLHTSSLRFYIYSQWYSYVRLSRVDVYGCYNTSTPTVSPTTVEPTEGPSVLPTISPTLAPVTTIPSRTPSVSPTSAPTVSPSEGNPSSYPSAAPTLSPTVTPTIKSVSPSQHPTAAPTSVTATYQPSIAPSSSPTLEPTTATPTLWPSTIPSLSPTEQPTSLSKDTGFKVRLGLTEFFIILIVLLVGAVFFILVRYRKVLQVNQMLRPALGNEMTKLQVVSKEDRCHIVEGKVSHQNDRVCIPGSITRTGGLY